MTPAALHIAIKETRPMTTIEEGLKDMIDTASSAHDMRVLMATEEAFYAMRKALLIIQDKLRNGTMEVKVNRAMNDDTDLIVSGMVDKALQLAKLEIKS